MADDKDTLVPEIRFKGFRDDWEQRKLGESISKIGDGIHGTPKYTNDGEFAFVNGNNLVNGKIIIHPETKMVDISQLTNTEKELDENTIMMSINGTIGNLAWYRNEKIMLGKSAAYLKVDKFDKKFAYVLLQTQNILSHFNENLTGTTIKNLGLKTIRETPVLVPSDITEQTSIGNLFRILDDTITLYKHKLSGLKELKNGYLQQMFPQVGESAPRVRFDGFTEPWAQRKLGDVVERVQGNDGRMDLPTLTISAGSGWLDQRERFSNNIAGKEQENYTLLSKGELSYNKGNSKLAKYGVVFELKTHKEALVPRVYHSFKATHESSAAFLEYMFATKIPDSELAKLITSGARMDGLLNIGFEAFMGIRITIPTKAEQVTISNFLRNIDEQITVQQAKLDKLKQLKAAYLQKMFL